MGRAGTAYAERVVIPPPRADADLLTALHADLTAADFTVAGISELLGPMATAALEREQALPVRRVTAGSGHPAATLVRLFTLGDPVDAAELDHALPTLRLAGAVDLGLVAEEGDGVVARCDLRPYACGESDHWLASDLGELALGRPVAPDHVLGIGGASMTLASWTPRTDVERALDIGTGCGVQALHLSAHARHVVVTDLSDRALGFARFNAALNGLTWEVLAGSMLEPVAGRQFDLVVSNPPFVITPRSGAVPLFAYRDAGAAGDAVVADLVRSAREVLAPDGVAQFLGNWEVPSGATWQQRVGGWLAGTGLDALVVQREVQDPAQYAETWARDSGHHPGTADFNAMYAAWLDDFAARDVEMIGFGVITVHRPAIDREPFVDLIDARGPVGAPMGPTITAALAAREWLATTSDDELLAAAWVAGGDVHVERRSPVGASDAAAILLHQGSGLRRTIRLSTVTAALVSVCDGELTARQASAAISGLLDLDQGEVIAEVVAFLRDAAKDDLLRATSATSSTGSSG